MITADTYVRARIDTATKDRAAVALKAMGLSISDAIRLLMMRVADERKLPFEIKVPNATTRAALLEAEQIIKTRRARYKNAKEVFDELEKQASK
jgi:DNA-damage-inducible protein J